MKKSKLFKLFVVVILLFATGCNGNNTKKELAVSLDDIRKEAENFSYDGTSIDVSSADIIIPESQTIYDLTFDLRVDSAEDIEEKFFEDLELYMNVSEINTDNVLYCFREETENVCVPFDEVTNEQKNNTNSCLIYCDGTYSKVLYNTSYMCEMGCNTIPTELTQDTTDYSENIWGYRGLDIGVYEKTYYIPDDDVSGVSYKLYDGEVNLQDAINYVEEHIKSDYNFAGSEYLDYKVFRVDVRRLDETTYYYQFKIKACYDGISFNKDAALSMTEEGYPIAESHIVSMYENESLGYIWASCHSYDYLELGKEYTEYITIEEACRVVDEKLTNETAFEVDTIELLYLTEFCFESEADIGAKVDSVICYPVYHFSVKNPSLSGYTAIYFDVRVDTGEVLISKY